MPRSAAGGSSSMARPTQTYPHPPPGQPSPEELTLFTTLSAYADALDALPLDLTRSFSDLRELDAVLGAHLNSLTNRLIHLAALIENPNVSPGERIVALKEVAEEARSYKMGGEDKIRVALNTAETIISHTTYIDTLLASFASVPSLAHLLNPPSQSHVAGHLSDGTPLAPGSGPGGNNPANANAYTDIITPNNKRKRPAGTGPSSGGLLNGMTGSATGMGSVTDKGRGHDASTTSQGAPATIKKRKPPGQGAVKAKAQGGNMNANASAAAQMAAIEEAEERKSAARRRANREEEDGARGDEMAARGRTARGRGGNARASASEDEDDDSEGDSNAGGTSSRPARVARAPRPAHGNHDMDVGFNTQPTTAIGEDADERRYCICNNVSYGDMIGCDDDDCLREWFHLGCVGLQKPPQGTWYCAECTQRRANRNAKGKKSKPARNGGGGMADTKARVMSSSKR